MEKISRQDIESAIKEIDASGRSDRPSFKFELLYSGKSYPPLLAVAIANRIAGGEELPPNSSSGGWASEEFKLLKKHGFRIVEKVRDHDRKLASYMFSKFGNKSALDSFFHLLEQLLTKLQVYSDDERLSITSRESGEQQISVNINARMVFSLQRLSGKNYFSFMTTNTMAERHRELWVGNKFLFQRDDDMVSVNVPTERISDVPKEFIDGWINACEAYLPSQKSSQYRKFHSQLLYRMAFDHSILNQLDFTNRLSRNDSMNYQETITAYPVAQSFHDYLTQFHKTAATPKEYVVYLNKVESWFKDVGIADPDFNIWTDKDDIERINNLLKDSYKDDWKSLNTNNNNWYSAPWNKWVSFHKEVGFNLNQMADPKSFEMTKKELRKFLLGYKAESLETVKKKFRDFYDEIFQDNQGWMVPVDEKLNLIPATDRATFLDVIHKLRSPNYLFEEKDSESLGVFSRVIDNTINACNFLNNYTASNFKKDGLTIYDFFNLAKSAESFATLNNKVRLTGTRKNFLPHYFSAIKYCQDVSSFPIYYKYWSTCMSTLLGKDSDYDTLVKFYRTFPESDRLMIFCSFFGALGKGAMADLKSSAEPKIVSDQIVRWLRDLIPQNRYVDEVFSNNSSPIAFEEFDIHKLVSAISESRLTVTEGTQFRFVGSLLAKRFLILTGLSGSGKTKLAQAFVKWISATEQQYLILPVAADWTNREPLFGYPNALNPEEYVRPESGVLDLILRAKDDSSNPYFLILDEMNLSHVERYFADFLSGLESDEEIPLHQNSEIKDVDKKVRLPKNLFVIGTVNIDETTYMFSPKVLDRANVIEFRVSEDEIAAFLANPVKPELEKLEKQGASMGASFVEIATRKDLPYSDVKELNDVLRAFFAQLKLSGAEFGYRSAYEMHRLAGALQELWPKYEAWEVIDICIMQKLLPKVHGSRKKMGPILKDMVKLCVSENVNVEDLLSKAYVQPADDDVFYPLSLEKLHRMYRGAIENGFTSYAEA